MAPPTRGKKTLLICFWTKATPPPPPSLFVELDEQRRLTCPLEFRAVKSQGEILAFHSMSIPITSIFTTG